MAKIRKRGPVKEAVGDEFNELGIRPRSVTSEEIICHSVQENRSEDIDVMRFTADLRVILSLEDGRVLNDVFTLEFEEAE